MFKTLGAPEITLILLIIGIPVCIVCISHMIRRPRIKRENAKKQALYWIVNGNIPSAAMYNQVHDILTKYRYDEECADILEKLTALKAMTASKK